MSPKDNSRDPSSPVTDSILLSLTKKIILPLIGMLAVTGIGWIAKSVNDSLYNIKTVSSNLAACTEDLEKMSERLEAVNNKYHKLHNNVTELKVRLEVTKLETMETSLMLKEQLEILKMYANRMETISSSGMMSEIPKHLPESLERPAPAPLPDDLENKVMEQRKLVESLKEAK